MVTNRERARAGLRAYLAEWGRSDLMPAAPARVPDRGAALRRMADRSLAAPEPRAETVERARERAARFYSRCTCGGRGRGWQGHYRDCPVGFAERERAALEVRRCDRCGERIAVGVDGCAEVAAAGDRSVEGAAHLVICEMCYGDGSAWALA